MTNRKKQPAKPQVTPLYTGKKSQTVRENQELGRNFQDYVNHFFAFLIDVNVSLFPIYVWMILFLLILTGVISPFYFDLLLYLMYGTLFVLSIIVLPLLCAIWNGQTIGGRIVGLRLVRKNLRSAPAILLILRQAIGMGIPIMVFGYFFSVAGLFVYWGINALVVLFSPHEQSIFDWVFGLVPVYARKGSLRLPAKPKTVPSSQKPPVAKETESSAKTDVKEVEKPARTETVQNPEVKPNIELPVTQPRVVTAPAKISPIDLHIRSNYSDDAQKDVEALMIEAKEKGIQTLSITDHNCARANGAARSFADYYGLNYIDGVEIDAQIGVNRVRILGYYIDWKDPFYNEIEQISLTREKEASLERAARFMNATKIRINLEAIMNQSRFQILTPQDLTTMVFENAKTRQRPFVQDYLAQYPDEAQARKAFERDYFGKDGPCEVSSKYPLVEDIIAKIHESGGLAILANWNLEDLEDELLADLLDMGLDGVEAFSSNSSLSDTAFLLKLAQQEKLLITAGSDYHGDDNPKKQMGQFDLPENALPLIEIFTKASKKAEN